VLAAASLVLGLAYLGNIDQHSPRGEDLTWSTQLVSFAERAPRLLVGEQGWMVIAAEEFDNATGEMTFANDPDAFNATPGPGTYWIALNWNPAHTHSDQLQDRSEGADRSWHLTIDGYQATLFEHEGTAPIGRTFYALWRAGEHSLELRSDVIPSKDTFKKIVESLHVVDVDTWLSALPATVIEPHERRDAIDEIVADIPVPANVDLGALARRDVVTNSLTYEVTTTIACGWVEEWVDATRSGDQQTRQQAVDALVSARKWRALSRPEAGQYKTYVFDVADAMSTNTPINDASIPIGVGYQRHLGCPED